MLPFLKDPELIFGLCSPIGTDNKKAKSLIRNELSKYAYKYEEYKVTDLMKTFRFDGANVHESPLESRYDSYIRYANNLRLLYGDSSILGMACCAAIRGHRRKQSGRSDAPISRQCYVFDQFKRKEEIDVLRQVYGGLFVLVSVYSDKSVRCERITKRIAESHAVSRPTEEHEAKAKALIRRDEDEDAVPTGQRLREAFPLADIFIDIDNEEEAKKTLEKFFRALFGSNAVSPNPDEYGMYLAQAASLRSLDLSRQVGAAILGNKGNVISLGCNEVPTAGGGQYWHDDNPDGRDFNRGNDENDRLKRGILADLVRKLVDSGSVKIQIETEVLVNEVLGQLSSKGSSLRGAEIMDLLEFGRIIHAEMAAICEAARTGAKVSGSALYCTTFPCHLCAKHIVASGINRVVYIEPYPKSYADQLHADSISVRLNEEACKKVSFQPFIGISPFRYRELFRRQKRKDGLGKTLDWEENKAMPIIELTTASYIQDEAAVVATLKAKLDELRSRIEVKSNVDLIDLSPPT